MVEIHGMKFYNADCMGLLRQMPDKSVELAIVDPPYRDENQPTKDMRKNGSMKSIKGRPNFEYWKEIFRVSKNHIIWGANNFELPQWKGFVVWKKLTISEDFTMSMCEVASLSEGLSTTSKFIELAPQGTNEDPRIHPNQKPVKLYEWLLKHYAQPNDRILDTHLGSGSIAIAIHRANVIDKMNLQFTGIELDKDYFDSAIKRITASTNQLTIF